MLRIRANLGIKAFSTIVVGVIFLSATFYFFSVPMIKQMTHEMEERAGRSLVSSMVEMVKLAHHDLLVWENSAAKSP